MRRREAPLQGPPRNGGVRRGGPDAVLRRHEGGRNVRDCERPRRLLHAEGLAPESEGRPEAGDGRGDRDRRLRDLEVAGWAPRGGGGGGGPPPAGRRARSTRRPGSTSR